MNKKRSIILLLIVLIGSFLIFNNNSNASELNLDNNTIAVDIKGCVENPGVYEINNNSTISELIIKSGGLTDEADTSLLNLSKRLNDEDVVIIYNTKEVLEMRSGSTSVKIVEKECMCPKIDNIGCINDLNTSSKQNANKININTASVDELSTLSGIGSSKAQKIVDYRNEILFDKIEDIMNVKGIGQTTFDKIKENITV